ncbi:MAG: DUF3052 domain-containing protein [Pseudomonadota bacterium]
MSKTAGYSGKPLFQKLGIKPGLRLLPLDAPGHYPELIEGAEGHVMLAEPGPADLVHLFCRTRGALEMGFPRALACADAGAMIWVSWPKKTSKLFVDLTEDGIREVVLASAWVDVKVCAVDADWSGLKLLRRKR